MTPRILIIAGSDSGGGAGIQADIKTVTMLGGHAMTAIAAVTAQNTLGVQAVHLVPPEIVAAQIRSCIADIGVDAVKIGMIGSAQTARAVAEVLEGLRAEDLPGERPSPASEPRQPAPGHGRGSEREGGGLPIILDPVMVATSGSALADAETIAALDRLIALATLVTPNLPELDALGGKAALASRAAALLVKGGHADGDTITDRLIVDGVEVASWSAPRIDTPHTHGTGCTLSTAIATNLARGLPLDAAVARARQFVRLALHDAPSLGGGHGPMGQQTVRLDLGDGPRLNQVTLPLRDPATAAFYRTLGLRQIVAAGDGHYARFEAPGGATLSIEAGARPTVFLECEDLDAEVARLQEAGVTFNQLPTEQPWRWREARLADPSGNALCLYQADENRRYPPWRIADA